VCIPVHAFQQADYAVISGVVHHFLKLIEHRLFLVSERLEHKRQVG